MNCSDAVLETATPNTLEEIGNQMIESQDTELIVDVITHLLEKNQDGFYESKVSYIDIVASKGVTTTI